MKKIGIIGAGAWGTALASQAIRAGNDVIIWAREPEVVKTINNDSVNDIFLPGFKLDRRLRATNILSEAVLCDMVFIVVPSQHFRQICNQIRAFWVDRTPAIICSKGIERKTNSLLTQVLLEEIPKAITNFLKKNKLSFNKIDYFIFHQANEFIKLEQINSCFKMMLQLSKELSRD